MTEQAQQSPDRPDELKRKLADAERERDEWKAHFEDVVQSKSWRLTEPLRALKRRFTR